MYQTINKVKKGYQHKCSIIRNKNGELAMNTKEKAEIWKEFCWLFSSYGKNVLTNY
jgi:hypothetical protein